MLSWHLPRGLGRRPHWASGGKSVPLRSRQKVPNDRARSRPVPSVDSSGAGGRSSFMRRGARAPGLGGVGCRRIQVGVGAPSPRQDPSSRGLDSVCGGQRSEPDFGREASSDSTLPCISHLQDGNDDANFDKRASEASHPRGWDPYFETRTPSSKASHDRLTPSLRPHSSWRKRGPSGWLATSTFPHRSSLALGWVFQQSSLFVTPMRQCFRSHFGRHMSPSRMA